ncbi:hypothetical protein SEA_ROMAN_9 [Microbacterium phage Roman]|nr:hypothetical protein SEA_ROMAN_9 [Microbacterium phage Roman]
MSGTVIERMGAEQVKVGDRIRVIGEFTVQEVNDTSWGTQFVHTDEDGQQWAFVPGSSTTSIEVIA